MSPQPSEDPNDPLNWAMWRKELIIAILSLGAMLNAGTNVSIRPELAFELGTTQASLTDLSCNRAHF